MERNTLFMNIRKAQKSGLSNGSKPDQAGLVGDGTPVDKIDDNTFKSPTIESILHRQR
jgi:hypothetical protein